MAIPRRNIIDPSQPVTCHCVSRCVRRLLLLEDRSKPEDLGDGNAASSREPDFWKKLLAARIVELVALFAIDVIEWAILGNHFHLLLATHPELVALWSDREIAVRWRTLTPDYHWRRRKKIPYNAPAQEDEIAAMLADPKAIAHARRVLADVSQFHKFLKQRIAQLANAEDDVTGHFWDGRFKSIVATDLPTVIAHMVYIALNPVRAGLAASLEECEFASIRARIDELKRRIEVGEFAGEVEEAKQKLRGLKLLPALPCDPGRDVRRMERLPNGAPNPWKGGAVPPVLEGLTISAFLDEADRVGRTERKGKKSLPPERAKVMAMLEARIENRLNAKRAHNARAVRGARVTRADGSTGVTIASPGPPAAAMDLLASVAAYAGPIEEALSQGLANAFGNFSGNLKSVARRAAELGRAAVWTIFDPEGREPRRWVKADRGE
ncbi:MAG: hypothetical protein U0572_17240 [Phycisphaerales bacterium]